MHPVLDLFDACNVRNVGFALYNSLALKNSYFQSFLSTILTNIQFSKNSYFGHFFGLWLDFLRFSVYHGVRAWNVKISQFYQWSCHQKHSNRNFSYLLVILVISMVSFIGVVWSTSFPCTQGLVFREVSNVIFFIYILVHMVISTAKCQILYDFITFWS